MSLTFPCITECTFVGLTEIKLFIGITNTTVYDVLLNEILDDVTSDFQEYMDRYMVINDWTETFDIESANEQQCIQLLEYPIVSIAGLTDNDLAIVSTDYLIYEDTGQVCLDGLYFTYGRQTVEITYRAGYSCECIPPTLRGAAKKEVASRYFAKGEGDLVYEKIGDYAYRLDTHEDSKSGTGRRTYGFSASVRRVLDYFRNEPV